MQSNYIPWKGYFDMINMVDEFVLYDDMQYTRRDWRNRNKIKTPNGSQWLTIPIEVKGNYLQKIKDAKISEKKWAKKHWMAIQLNYKKAHCFKTYKELFEELYLTSNQNYLSEINYTFILEINKILGIKTKISWSSDYELNGERSEKLLNICKQSGTMEYISGPAAKNYLNVKLFEKENIKVTWMDYIAYPEYYQLYPPFEHSVSILDLIFNEGENSKNFLKSNLMK